MNLISTVLLIIFLPNKALLPPKQKCDKYGDTFGNWYKLGSTEYTKIIANNDSFVSSHFFNHEVGSALLFSKIWIPNNCSYQRFTMKTINTSVHLMLENLKLRNEGKSNETVELIFLGDSSLRGIFCGISRILSGSEIEGPNNNTVCGGGTAYFRGHKEIKHPQSYPSFGLINHVDFGHLRLSFIYVKTFHFKHFDWLFENSINRRPYAIIFNTGAWDFQDIYNNTPRSDVHNSPRSTWNNFYNKTEPPGDQIVGDDKVEECLTNKTAVIAAHRANTFVNFTIWRMNELALKLDVRLIYRTNHFNSRFGVLCADKQFEALLKGSIYEIWDNKRLSRSVWQSQTYDGFHFDRTFIHSIEQHRVNLAQWVGELPGQLEIQLAQSLLNAVFYDVI
mmetsp:Transcript_14405/g.13884  ORF Transcript_14405/g.13884 Transcript_14405/m.13884 type:complete len:392 (-) Transcript_14405:226-1401(-)